MAKINTFKLDSFIDEIEKDLAKAEKDALKKAGNFLKRRVRAKIKTKNLVDEGDLLKGVSSTNMEHATLVGMAAPAYHALLVEFGHIVTLPEGHSEKARTTKQGPALKVVPPNPFFLPAFEESLTEIQNILSETWL